MTNPVRDMADAAEEKLRDEYDLLCRGIPSAREIADVRIAAGERSRGGGVVASEPCARCAAMRRLVERLVEAGVDWLDDGDAAAADREDDETEVVSEDDGIVDARTLGRGLR